LYNCVIGRTVECTRARAEIVATPQSRVIMFSTCPPRDPLPYRRVSSSPSPLPHLLPSRSLDDTVFIRAVSLDPRDPRPIQRTINSERADYSLATCRSPSAKSVPACPFGNGPNDRLVARLSAFPGKLAGAPHLREFPPRQRFPLWREKYDTGRKFPPNVIDSLLPRRARCGCTQQRKSSIFRFVSVTRNFNFAIRGSRQSAVTAVSETSLLLQSAQSAKCNWNFHGIVEARRIFLSTRLVRWDRLQRFDQSYDATMTFLMRDDLENIASTSSAFACYSLAASMFLSRARYAIGAIEFHGEQRRFMFHERAVGFRPLPGARRCFVTGDKLLENCMRRRSAQG